MPHKSAFYSAIVMSTVLLFSIGCQNATSKNETGGKISIVASDTILSGMSESLLSPERFTVDVILPPGQCPGHYDLKLSDIAKVKKADLVISFSGMPFMQGAEIEAGKELAVASGGRNWMAPDSYIFGLQQLAADFSERFPESTQQIALRLQDAIQEVVREKDELNQRIALADIAQKPIIVSAMIREPLEWMGFRVVGEYDRPESISVREIADLTRTGKSEQVVLVADNLQSGPDAGRGIAEALSVSHVVLANFPLENGYATTLSDNVNTVLAALSTK